MKEIITTGKTVLTFNGLITVNEVGADLWKMLQSEVTFGDLLKGILEIYDVDEETAKEDIQEFLDTLIEGGILDKPEETGPDRIANAAAVYHLYKKTSIVVDFGTATTFDVVLSDGRFLGGVIAPGIRIGAKALSNFTSRLPKVKIEAPAKTIGKNTIDAILSGLVGGHAAMIDGMVDRIEDELGEPAMLILTGGYSDIVVERMRHRFDILDHNLTLEGLRLIYEMQKVLVH